MGGGRQPQPLGVSSGVRQTERERDSEDPGVTLVVSALWQRKVHTPPPTVGRPGRLVLV